MSNNQPAISKEEVLKKHHDLYVSTLSEEEQLTLLPFESCLDDPAIKMLWDAMQEFADQQVRPYELALTSLTPGGSEYVNDPKACTDFVRGVRDQKHNFIIKQTTQIRELTAETAALREENERLKAENAELRVGLIIAEKEIRLLTDYPNSETNGNYLTIKSILSKHKP